MRVYRIQNDNGNGFLTGNGSRNIIMNFKLLRNLKYNYSHILPDGTERCQHPDADIGTDLYNAYWNKMIYTGSSLRFGFGSIKDLYTWCCPATIGFYEAYNITIYEYIIPDEYVIKGTRQVVFDPSNAINVRKLSHKELRRIKD